MKYFIGKDVDSAKIIVGHDIVYFGSHVRIQTKGKGKNDSGESCTVVPDSIYVIEGDIQRVVNYSTRGGLITEKLFID